MGTTTPDIQAVAHLSNEDISLYVDALKLQRTRELPEKVRDHVANCQDCRKEITGLFSILAEENYAAMGPHPYFDSRGEGKDKKVRWVYQIAALVAAGVGISILAYFSYSGGGDGTPRVPNPSSRSAKSSETVTEESTTVREAEASSEATYAGTFAELPELESLVATETRSAGIDVVTPAIGMVVHQPVVFNWAADGDVSLTLSVLTNKDSIVHTVRAATLPYVLRRSLTPGLYYWKLENREEVVFVGKFLVK